MKAVKRDPGGDLKISGSLDIDSADAIRESLLQCLEPREGEGNCERWDLSEVEFCDVSGLQILLAAQKTAISIGSPFQFASVPPAVADIAAALGLSIGGFDAA